MHDKELLCTVTTSVEKHSKERQLIFFSIFSTMLSVVLLCCVSLFAVTSSLPTGAPDVTCNNLTPNGPHVANGIVEQPTANPWTIDICNFDEIMGFYTYQPGQTYNITLRPAQGADLTLRGFTIQGRTQITNDMVGTFADPAPLNNLTRLSSCTPPTVGVTHNNPLRIDQPGPLTFTWTAPAAGTGPIWFRYTIVQNVSIWWADDSSAIVQEVSNLVFPSGAPQLQGVGFWTLLVSAAAITIKTVL